MMELLKEISNFSARVLGIDPSKNISVLARKKNKYCYGYFSENVKQK